MDTWEKQFLERDILSSRPISQRLRNGLKFDMGGGGNTYVLQVQPTHYRDSAGDMVPIDLNLRVDGSGFFGAPGLPFKVSDDGRISIGVFQSLVDLEANRGLVDGNRMIREFTGGREIFTLNERGIKHEIVLDYRPPQNFIARVIRTGNLPSGFIEHPVICIDASGSRYLVDEGNPAGLRNFLDGAIYPVIIDPTYTLQPDGTAGLDTYLQSSTPTTNRGGNTVFYVGELTSGADTLRTLIKFDLSGIPASEVCTSATLSLWHTLNDASNTRTMRVYRQLRDWVETQATWNIWKTSNNWATAGGFNAADCEQTDIGSRSFVAAEANGEKQWTLTASKIEEMYDGAFTNNGFMIKNDTEANDAHEFRSSDSGTAGERPKLVIITTTDDGGSPIFFF